jgi:GxxExxY protein
MPQLPENILSKAILDAAIEVHRVMGGPGLLESVYEEALCEELRLRGHAITRQESLPLIYKGKELATPLRLDIRVDNLVLIDCKAVVQWNAIFEAQMLTYLRLTGLRLGLVINFGERFVANGLKRVANGLPTDADYFQRREAEKQRAEEEEA